MSKTLAEPNSLLTLMVEARKSEARSHFAVAGVLPTIGLAVALAALAATSGIAAMNATDSDGIALPRQSDLASAAVVLFIGTMLLMAVALLALLRSDALLKQAAVAEIELQDAKLSIMNSPRLKARRGAGASRSRPVRSLRRN